MNAQDLNQALNHVDEGYLLELDTSDKEQTTMKTHKKTFRILALAAAIALLSVTAYAADFLGIRSLESAGQGTHYRSYAQIQKAVSKANLSVNLPETLPEGYTFREADVETIRGKDENGHTALTYRELNTIYADKSGNQLYLAAYLTQEGLPKSNSIPSETRTVNGVTMSYQQDLYRLVPGDYQPTPEDEAWSRQPNHYISYGSSSIQEQTTAFLTWQENGVSYMLYELDTTLPADTLFSIAETLLQG